MRIPETIKGERPSQFDALEIRFIGGHYYTYLVSAKWDATKGRPQKVTGKSIHKITESDKRKQSATDAGNAYHSWCCTIVKNKALTKIFCSWFSTCMIRSEIIFPDFFREIRTIWIFLAVLSRIVIFTIALLCLIDGISSAKMIQPLFLASNMSDLCSDIAVSKGSVRRFIAMLRDKQVNIDAFRKTQVMQGTTLMFGIISILSVQLIFCSGCERLFSWSF